MHSVISDRLRQEEGAGIFRIAAHFYERVAYVS